MSAVGPGVAHAHFGSRWAQEVVEVADDVECLDREGFWAVVITFEGKVRCVRFAQVVKDWRGDGRSQQPRLPPAWAPLLGDWSSSLDTTAYLAGVSRIRDRIAAGEVYQVSLCRILSHALAEDADLGGLETLVTEGNPAPYAGRVLVPEAGLDVLGASPEAFLIRSAGRIESRPIKGTSTTISTMLAKDYAENVMIADLVRNDLSPVCRPGTVSVDALCAPEEHPGLTHLVTTVSGELRPGVSWAEILATTFPPGSVSGAPKSSALRAIADLEAVPRGPYCGAIGWVDADTGEAELAVGIRTFWAEQDVTGQRALRFGTGAGITWASDPAQEWAETELKAARLIGLASGRVGT
ncbi:MAG: chorismate-binding protein [Dermatophilaceae bacterium]